MPFSITRLGLAAPSADELAGLRRDYAAQHCVLLRGFLDPGLFAWMNRRVTRAATWDENVHAALDPPSIDLILRDDTLAGTTTALMHAPGVFDAVRAVTGCDPIGSFGFRVYRMDPDAGHTDTWHGDIDGNRLVTLSVNLGTEPFEGGDLQIREFESKRVVHRVHNTGPGDAILFRIDPSLEHYVADVRGRVPKYALAGWFQRRPIVGLGRLVHP